MDIKAVLQLKSVWKTFNENHPKFYPFLQAAQGTIREGSVIELAVTTPEGKRIESNLKITASDLELFETVKRIRN